MNPSFYVGLISGTSMDGIDCALVSITDEHLKLIDFISPQLDDTLKSELIQLCSSDKVSLVELGELDNKLGHLFALTTNTLLEKNSLTSKDISAIGSHGQTVWHQPKRNTEDDIVPFTLQIADPNILSQVTGISTVADFRRRDMAASGQAAPLVPAFHQYLYQNSETNRVILNLGGFANITCLPADSNIPVSAFDTGPANVLMDTWIYKTQGKQFDQTGKWAASGKIDPVLLNTFLDEPYLSLPPPKSTGRELFNAAWLESKLSQHHTIAPEDIQATLLEFTVLTICNEIKNIFDEGEVIVCGGGVNNSELMEKLANNLKAFSVVSSEHYGMNPDAMEAAAFAWMAHQTINRNPIDLTEITGSSEPAILGGVYFSNQGMI